MNILSRLHRKAAGFLGKLLYTSVVVCGLGIASMPAQATSVTVDPAPLIVQPSLPPNITLMLDDSGSMTSDYMPDLGYLPSDTAGTTVNPDSYRNAANNGTYYDPTVTYSTPPYAATHSDGTTNYPTPTNMGAAPDNGFGGTATDDITSYKDSANGNYNYYTSLAATNTTTYSPTNKTCNSGDSLQTSGTHSGQCKHSSGGTTSYYSPTLTCNSGDTYSSTTGLCTNSATGNKNFFTYDVGTATGTVAAGTLVRHYVGKTTGDCASLTSATNKAVCLDDAATQQNVATWFSFYRRRILMAKSGLMNAFSTVNASYRVGFGSINGNNDGALPALSNSYGNNGNNIAEVAPFGDGTGTTQKANFWNWVAGESANNSTPLRDSLDAVGQYYETSQPWSTMSTDPDPTANANTELACRQSYTILTTDGFWNGPTPTGIGDADGTAGTTVTGSNSQTYTYSPAVPYADSTITTTTVTASPTCASGTLQTSGTYKGECKSGSGSSATYSAPTKCGSGYTYNSSTLMCTKTTTSGGYTNTLADVAMHYWETDLRPNTANEVPPSSEDPAFWQHMTTFTMGLGFTPTNITPAGTTIDNIFAWADGGAAISGFSWPQPSSNSINNIADLAHAAVNGHGGFYSATNPTVFANGLIDALARASQRVGTGASLAANSTQLQTGTVAYQANYFTSSWTGDLKAFSVDSTSGAISTTPSWTASQELPTAANRTIYTYNPSTSTYVAFQVATDGTLPALSTAQNTALSTLSGSATNETNMINYLRGDDSQDVANKGSYRNRTTPLGDIVDSQPVYVGAPNPDQFYTESFTGISTFATYASTNASRTGLIYVAANDGLLHAFNAGTGVEQYAYLPGAVITSGLTALADPQYGATVSHEYFNDGELTVADAYKSSDSTWHTILVGTTGRGLAEAVYALDVTNPSSIQFLWEHSSGDGVAGSNYIGQMTGKPVIAQTASGVWSVLIGNGYNSPAGKAALLQFDLFSGALTVHQTTDTSGLAAPAVWMAPSGNGISTTAYAGDADGDVWSFTLNTSVGTTATATPSSAGVLLYTAKSASGTPQPITAGLLVGQDSQTGNVWVFFGTGKYLSSSDLTDLSTQTWYGLIVQSADPTVNPSVTSGMTRANLAQRSITAQTAGTPAIPANPNATPPTAAVPAVLPARTVTTAAAASSLTGQSGWYIDLVPPSPLVAQGERMVTSNQFQGDLLVGTTRIPEATDACNPSGQGWIMAIDPFTGTNPQASFFDVNGDGSINASDTINGVPAAGIGFSSLPNNPIFVGSSMLTSFDNGTTSSIQTSSSTGGMHRVSWRELINQ